MSYIQTVTGKISPETIIFCHCHEHLMLSKGKSYEINPALCIDDFDKSLTELQDFFNHGGTTVVDAQPVGCNRMAEELVALSEKTNVRIISSTGFHKMIFYPDNHWIFQYNTDKLADLFLHEIRSGMYVNSDASAPYEYISAKAGIIKCALDHVGLDYQYEKLFSAASYAANLTNAPLMIHIEQNSDPVLLADYLRRCHVDLNRVIFCHMDRACPDLSVHKELCSRGIYMEYDTIGRPKYHDDIKEAAIFLEMIDAGYEGKLLFSLDTTRARLKSYTPSGVGMTYIIHTFIPLLKSYGISEDQLKKIACYNCRQILAF